MPEKYCARIVTYRPTRGEYMCVPLASYIEYELARYLVFSRAYGYEAAVTESFLHGELAQGGLIMGQRPVVHCGLKGDVAFSLPFEPLSDNSDVVRIGSSLTYGFKACFGQSGVMGVLLDNGVVEGPKNGVFNTGGFCVRKLSHSDPFLSPTQTYLVGQKGHKFNSLAYSPMRASYVMDERDWLAQPRSDGQGYISAAGWKRKWNVTVVWDGSTVHCTAETTSNLHVRVVAYQLRWEEVGMLSNNRTFTTYSSVTSEAYPASNASVISFISEVLKAKSWAYVDQYDNEGRQAVNDALDSYRTLRSNNIENALQWSKVEKLLPLEAARAFAQASSSSSTKAKAGFFAKAVSSVYLWWRYVAKTTYRDLKDLMDNVPSLLPKEEIKELRGRVFTTRPYDHANTTWVAATCRVDPYSFSLLPMRWGVHPGLAQAWDLIPLSFVVDWVAGVSNQLNAIDWFIYRNLFKLHYLIRARRTEVVVDASEFGGVGTIVIGLYSRMILLSWPGFLDSIPNPRYVPIRHWATAATALAISLWKGPR